VSQVVEHGSATQAVVAIPDKNYILTKWMDNKGNTYPVSNPYADTLTAIYPTQNLTLTASFVLNTYNVLFTAGENGSVSGSTVQDVIKGQDATPVFAVPDEGFHLVMWQDENNKKVSELDTFVVQNVTAPMSYKAIFGINSYAYTSPVFGNGTAAPDRATANHGEEVSFSIAARAGSKIDSVYYNNANVTADIKVLLTTCGAYSPTQPSTCKPIMATYTVSNAFEDGTLIAFFSESLNSQHLERMQVQVYPNPATSGIYIQSEQMPEHIRITDLSGKTMLERLHPQRNQAIDIEALQPGVYLIQLRTGGTTLIHKLIKQ